MLTEQVDPVRRHDGERSVPIRDEDGVGQNPPAPGDDQPVARIARGPLDEVAGQQAVEPGNAVVSRDHERRKVPGRQGQDRAPGGVHLSFGGGHS